MRARERESTQGESTEWEGRAPSTIICLGLSPNHKLPLSFYNYTNHKVPLWYEPVRAVLFLPRTTTSAQADFGGNKWDTARDSP